jgi:hypothetical protein
MSRTIPSFIIALAMEEKDWKPFRNALDKKDRKEDDETLFDLSKFYISACSNSVQYVRLYPILMSILIDHYKELTGYIKEVERIEAKSTARKKGIDEGKGRRAITAAAAATTVKVIRVLKYVNYLT